MKKFIILLVGILLLTTGCGKIGKKEVIRDLNKKIQGLKSYYVEGKMEIINNEDVYKYDVYVAYKNKDLFKVSLDSLIRGDEKFQKKIKVESSKVGMTFWDFMSYRWWVIFVVAWCLAWLLPVIIHALK